jgi:putative DNA primase/helicase
MVEPHGLRQIEDTLLVPMIDSGRNLWSLQFISADGRKLFMRGGRTKYVFHVIEGARDEIGVCEGYATGAAIYKLTGATVYCAFNAGNLERVTMLARAQHEGASLTVWGDDDRQTPGNPGRTKAELAARQANAKACFPDFSRFDPHSHPNPTDFNDYLLMEEGAWA